MKLFGKPLELVILDVDGVILELIAPLRRDLEAIARESDLPVGSIHDYFAAVYAGFRHGHASLKDGLREFWPQLTPEESLRLAWRFQDYRQKNPWPAVSGSAETIRWLREQHIPLALCTTNDQPTLEQQLTAAGIEPSFFVATSTWENGFPKPDPRALDPIFRTVEVPRDRAVYIGDWHPDLECARGAGVKFIAVLSGGIPKHAFLREGVPEDHIIERLADLPKLITG